MGLKKYLLVGGLSTLLFLGACGNTGEEISDPGQPIEDSIVDDRDEDE